MMLMVDAGNTRIKWGLATAGVLSAPGACTYKGLALAETLGQVWSGLQTPERILAANVAGAGLGGSLADFCRQRFGREVEFVQASAKSCGVTNAYAQPVQLGADRWAAIIGAHHIYKGPACVISCGTAITIDGVTGDGRHLGGLIAAGLTAMQQALADAAPVLPREVGGNHTLFAQDTQTAVTSGLLYAAAGFIERTTGEMRARLGEDTKLLLTGGDIERLRPLLHGRFTLAPHLVLEGLALLAEQV
ncbi:MAG: type III pantothenate kinase [Gammaproteobacteria bacterium]|nr:type III pantothenate kinase [Gammaproteobacteria bacterium]